MTIHNNPVYICDFCKKEFSSKSSCKEHEEEHRKNGELKEGILGFDCFKKPVTKFSSIDDFLTYSYYLVCLNLEAYRCLVNLFKSFGMDFYNGIEPTNFPYIFYWDDRYESWGSLKADIVYFANKLQDLKEDERDILNKFSEGDN